jgi:hypothetical protein
MVRKIGLPRVFWVFLPIDWWALFAIFAFLFYLVIFGVWEFLVFVAVVLGSLGILAGGEAVFCLFLL